jgi:ATP-dependent exoDNAse (exonuclease V) alpha subunit
VLNGDRWIVVGADETGLVIRPVGRAGQDRSLPTAYLSQPGWLQHAYAVTVAVSQGSTVERSYVLGSDATYREAGYTAASRARGETRFYVVGRQPLDTDDRLMAGSDAMTDPLEELAVALSRSAAQDLALDTRDER